MTVASYYAGGARVVIDGVPIRMARRPSKANLAWSREHEKQRVVHGSERYWTKPGAERKKFDRDQAKGEIASYARALGISYFAALRRAVKQARIVEATPIIDQSLEYDL